MSTRSRSTGRSTASACAEGHEHCGLPRERGVRACTSKGVIPAALTPFDETGAVDTAALARNTDWVLEQGAAEWWAPARWVRPRASAQPERRLVLETLVEAAAGRVTVTAGGVERDARHVDRLRRGCRRGRCGGANAASVSRLSGDAREIETFYRAVAESTDLPIMAYNNPSARHRHAPGADRAACRDRRRGGRQGMPGDARRISEILNATEDFEVLVGGDDWALEGFCAGAVGWVAGVANVARVTVSSCSVCVARDVSPRRASSTPAAPARAPGHAAQARAVLQGGHGPRRARRRPLPAPALTRLTRSSRRSRRRSRRSARGSPGESEPGLLGGRLPHGGHAHARDHGRRGPDSRRLDARAQAPLREASRPPAPPPDARAARPQRDVRGHPAAARRRRRGLGSAFHRGVGLPAHVRPRHDRRGHGAGGDRMVEVTEPETLVRLDTPAGPVEARVAVEGGRARSVALRCPRFCCARSAGFGSTDARSPSTWPSAATSTRCSRPSPPGSAWTRPAPAS